MIFVILARKRSLDPTGEGYSTSIRPRRSLSSLLFAWVDSSKTDSPERQIFWLLAAIEFDEDNDVVGACIAVELLFSSKIEKFDLLPPKGLELFLLLDEDNEDDDAKDEDNDG